MNIMKSHGSSSATMAGQGVEKTRVLLITGLSGAGKSTALKAIEDLGYDAVDNLPLPLLHNLFESPDNYRRAGSKAPPCPEDRAPAPPHRFPRGCVPTAGSGG